MRGAYFATYAAVLLVFHGIFFLLDIAGVIPYFRTVFYPVFAGMPVLLSVLGFFERDRVKWPSIITGLAGLALVTHWVVMLVMRLKALD